MNISKIFAILIGILYTVVGVYWQFIEMPVVNKSFLLSGEVTPLVIRISPILFILFGLLVIPLSIYLKKIKYLLIVAIGMPILLYVVGRLVL